MPTEGSGPFEVRTRRPGVLPPATGVRLDLAPGRSLVRPDADVVLTVALGRYDPSARFREVVHPSSRHWVHHVELRSTGDIDDGVLGWLREAAERAG